ncbi:uncharacterized protein PAC_18345 [Phialocephala subalpina]|uniref:Uncharacterized protein n=1 Tax=Phialocephala subalpina TaxID=576137 RepID=A0A1L7XTU1_9HELO|nr:uncharacterized protein PAC_18345 [Phialocephala subalpina]
MARNIVSIPGWIPLLVYIVSSFLITRPVLGAVIAERSFEPCPKAHDELLQCAINHYEKNNGEIHPDFIEYKENVQGSEATKSYHDWVVENAHKFLEEYR